jgi:hypothetical protein
MKGPIFPQAIADEIGLTRVSVQHMVTKLADDKAIVRTLKGYVAVSRARVRTDVPDNSDNSGVTRVIEDTRAKGSFDGMAEPSVGLWDEDLAESADDDEAEYG